MLPLPYLMWGYIDEILRLLVVKHYYRELNKRRDAIPAWTKNIRDTYLSEILKASLFLGGVYLFVKFVRSCRSLTSEPHGALQPTTIEEVRQRDAEVNPWVKASVEPIPMTKMQKTATAEQVIASIGRKNVVHCDFTMGEKSSRCGGFIIRTGMLLMPQHIWYPGYDRKNERYDSMNVTITRREVQ
jgi:hypothetical protein